MPIFLDRHDMVEQSAEETALLHLEDLKIRSVSKGKDALGDVSVEINVDNHTYHGNGVSVDIIEGSARAYLKALNKAIAESTTEEPAES